MKSPFTIKPNLNNSILVLFLLFRFFVLGIEAGQQIDPHQLGLQIDLVDWFIFGQSDFAKLVNSKKSIQTDSSDITVGITDFPR